MYGLEGILGNLVTSVATPAIGGIAGDVVGSAVEDATQSEFLKQLSQTTMGALAGAGVGAGLGALTGGKSGALSGAITGGVGGGVGGYNAQDISSMFGMGGPQSVEAPQASSREAVAEQLRAGAEFNPQQTLVPPADGVGPSAPGRAYMGLSQDTMQSIRDLGGAPPSGPVNQSMVNVQRPLETAGVTSTAPRPSEYKGYIDFLKKNYEPLAGGFYLGSAYGANQDTEEQAKKYQQNKILADLLESQKARDFARSVYYPRYADGGAVNLGIPATSATPQVNIHIPAWAQADIQSEGGLAALQPGLKQGMAAGGYINLQPMGETTYPQALIPRAQPYAAASPQRREVVGGFARGGLIDGAGDGMSDSIPAHIEGQEPVKVADGEYLIPKEVAEKYGPEKLKHMMTKVRAAAHAKKGRQIVQDAAKRALISSLTGVQA